MVGGFDPDNATHEGVGIPIKPSVEDLLATADAVIVATPPIDSIEPSFFNSSPMRIGSILFEASNSESIALKTLSIAR